MTRGHSRLVIPVVMGAIVLLAGWVLWMWRSDASLAGMDDDEARMERLHRAGDVKALGELAHDGNERTAFLAVRALGRCGEDAADELRRLLTDERPKIRAVAAVALARAAPPSKGAILANQLRTDTSTSVRVAAATALGRMKASEQIEAVLDAAEDPEQPVRAAADAAIHKITGVDFRIPLDARDAAARHTVVLRIRKLVPGIKARGRAERNRNKR